MNKIYNNLNIDNLMKTEEYNYFNDEQKEEIRLKLLREKQRQKAMSKILHDISFLLNILVIALDLL